MSFQTDDWQTADDVTRQPPHAVGPEKAVISIIMQYPEMLDESPSLCSDHFYDPSRRTLFAILAERIHSGKSVEFVGLTQELHDKGKLAAIGGPSMMTELYSYAPSPGHFHAHVVTLNEKLACRMAIRAANEIIQVAHSAPEPSELIDVTSAPITALHDTLTASRPSKNTKSLLKAFYEAFQDRMTGKVLPAGISVSIHIINRMFGGLQKGHVWVLSAFPSGGKTAMAMQLAVDAALGGHNTLVCSLEMSGSQLMQRTMSYVAKVHGKAISDPLEYVRENGLGSLPKKITDSIGAGIRNMVAAPFQVEDLIGANVHQIAAIIRRAHRKLPLDVVVVDFVQRITPAPEKARENREQQLSHASNTLANLAKELGFCLILASQLNKEGAAKHAETINEDADLHLQIMQDADKAHLGVKVAKDRHCGKGGMILPIVLDAEYLRFKEVDPASLKTEEPKARKNRYQNA